MGIYVDGSNNEPHCSYNNNRCINVGYTVISFIVHLYKGGNINK